MTRYIFCAKCGESHSLHHEDKRAGFKYRKVFGTAAKPPDLTVTVYDVPGDLKVFGMSEIMAAGKVKTKETLPIMYCDSCHDELPDGIPVVAVSLQKGAEPPEWEAAYLNPMEYEEWAALIVHFAKVNRRLDGKPAVVFSGKAFNHAEAVELTAKHLKTTARQSRGDHEFYLQNEGWMRVRWLQPSLRTVPSEFEIFCVEPSVKSS